MNSRERVLGLIDGHTIDRRPLMPITMMFAADQSGVKYGAYAASHRALVAAQLHVAEIFDFDYVSGISDPAREAADCGAAVQYFDNQPPAMDEANALLADTGTLARLKFPDPLGGGRMHDRINALAQFCKRVGGEKVIEGWVEGPCATAANLRGINTLMLDFFDDTNFVRDLFAFALELGLRFGRAQVQAGADLIGIGDAAASLVGPDIYDEFVWPYEKRLVDGLHALGARVRLHICGNTNAILESMGRLGCDIVDLDSMVSLADARKRMGDRQVLLGNVATVAIMRNGTPETVAAAVEECSRQAGERYIIGAGCEIPRDTSPENVRALSALTHSH